MSYCRTGVYAYRGGGVYYIHAGEENISVETPQEFRDHLIRLNAPAYAIARINREIAELEAPHDR